MIEINFSWSFFRLVIILEKVSVRVINWFLGKLEWACINRCIALYITFPLSLETLFTVWADALIIGFAFWFHMQLLILSIDDIISKREKYLERKISMYPTTLFYSYSTPSYKGKHDPP